MLSFVNYLKCGMIDPLLLSLTVELWRLLFLTCKDIALMLNKPNVLDFLSRNVPIKKRPVNGYDSFPSFLSNHDYLTGNSRSIPYYHVGALMKNALECRHYGNLLDLCLKGEKLRYTYLSRLYFFCMCGLMQNEKMVESLQDLNLYQLLFAYVFLSLKPKNDFVDGLLVGILTRLGTEANTANIVKNLFLAKVNPETFSKTQDFAEITSKTYSFMVYLSFYRSRYGKETEAVQCYPKYVESSIHLGFYYGELEYCEDLIVNCPLPLTMLIPESLDLEFVLPPLLLKKYLIAILDNCVRFNQLKHFINRYAFILPVDIFQALYSSRDDINLCIESANWISNKTMIDWRYHALHAEILSQNVSIRGVNRGQVKMEPANIYLEACLQIITESIPYAEANEACLKVLKTFFDWGFVLTRSMVKLTNPFIKTYCKWVSKAGYDSRWLDLISNHFVLFNPVRGHATPRCGGVEHNISILYNELAQYNHYHDIGEHELAKQYYDRAYYSLFSICPDYYTQRHSTKTTQIDPRAPYARSRRIK